MCLTGKAGGNVFIVDINQESLDKAAKELKAQKISVMTAAVDVSKYITTYNQ